MDTNREKKDVERIGDELQQQTSGSSPAEGYQAYPGTGLFEERNRQRRQLGRELQELEREIRASDGYRLYSRMSLLKNSHFVFDVNHLNLKRVLEEFEQPMTFLKLWEERDQGRFDLFMNDVIRLFHNYLAGAATLLGHIRTVQDGIRWGADFSEEYRTRWDQQFGGSSLPQFVEDLLAHMLHEELPLAVAELSFDRGSGVEVDSAIKLDAGKLGEWERWSEKGREYLDTLDNKAGLDDIVEEHAAIIGDFYRWFVTRQTELHQESLDRLEELRGKRQQLQQKIRDLEDTLESAEKTAINMREERERMAKQLEAERQYREWDRERAKKIETELENELNKGFWARVFGRRKRA